jgi:hypothetical protein
VVDLGGYVSSPPWAEAGLLTLRKTHLPFCLRWVYGSGGRVQYGWFGKHTNLCWTPPVSQWHVSPQPQPQKDLRVLHPSCRADSEQRINALPEPKFYLMQQPRPFPFVNTASGVGVEVCYARNTCVMLAAPCVLPNLPTRMVICNLAYSKLETTAHSCSHKGASNPHTTPPVSSTSSS